jgi:hypothetical protein
MRSSMPIGRLLLCIWLIVFGLVQLVHLNFAYHMEIMGALAIAAGILLLLDR